MYSEQCNLPSNEFEVIVSAIESELHGFSIYPNPAKDEITVENRGMQEVKIEIVSINGRVLISKESNEHEVKMDLSNVSPGLYLLKMDLPNETILRRIIVQ